jgi:hypothetical protein
MFGFSGKKGRNAVDNIQETLNIDLRGIHLSKARQQKIEDALNWLSDVKNTLGCKYLVRDALPEDGLISLVNTRLEKKGPRENDGGFLSLLPVELIIAQNLDEHLDITLRLCGEQDGHLRDTVNVWFDIDCSVIDKNERVIIKLEKYELSTAMAKAYFETLKAKYEALKAEFRATDVPTKH